MSALILPDVTGPVEVTPRLISRRRDLVPTLNGPTNRYLRPGSRFAMDFTMPPFDYADEAMDWIAALVEGDGRLVSMRVPQPDFDPGAPGSVQVNGVGQIGNILNIDGGTAQYVFRRGQFFSLPVADDSFLYMVRAETIAGEGGVTALPIQPMIRKSPADNTLINVAEPVIVGWLTGDAASWKVDVARMVGISFTIEERH
jgi:hypothetical protein